MNNVKIKHTKYILEYILLIHVDNTLEYNRNIAHTLVTVFFALITGLFFFFSIRYSPALSDHRINGALEGLDTHSHEIPYTLTHESHGIIITKQ